MTANGLATEERAGYVYVTLPAAWRDLPPVSLPAGAWTSVDREAREACGLDVAAIDSEIDRLRDEARGRGLGLICWTRTHQVYRQWERPR